MRVGWAVLLLLVAGCYSSPAFDGDVCTIRCTTSCPDSLVCAGSGYCVASPGQGCTLPSFDAATHDGPIDARPDARTGTFLVQLSAGTGYACALDNNGQLYCWGTNVSRIITSDANTSAYPTAQPIGSKTWASIAAGDDHLCAIDTAGAMYCWGLDDLHGDIGSAMVGSATNTPVRVGTASDWTAVGIGVTFSCGLEGSAMSCWGSGDNLATGGAAGPTPQSVAGTWASFATGETHTCAIGPDHQPACWGTYNYGDTGSSGSGKSTMQNALVMPGGTTAASIAVTSSASCAISSTTELDCWGNSETAGASAPGGGNTMAPVATRMATGWTEISGAEDIMCGVNNQAVYCWGKATYGGLGDGHMGAETAFKQVNITDDGGNPVAIAHVSAGQNIDTTPAGTGTGSGGLTVSSELGCALATNQLDVYCWGNQAFGALGNNVTAGVSGPVKVMGLP